MELYYSSMFRQKYFFSVHFLEYLLLFAEDNLDKEIK